MSFSVVPNSIRTAAFILKIQRSHYLSRATSKPPDLYEPFLTVGKSNKFIAERRPRDSVSHPP